MLLNLNVLNFEKKFQQVNFNTFTLSGIVVWFAIHHKIIKHCTEPIFRNQ